MDIKALLPREHVLLHLRSGDMREVLAALTAPLVVSGVVLDGARFLADLVAREAEVTTQVSGGIAFPHARSEAVRRLGLTVGVADEPGVTFHRESTESCRVFFLMAVPMVAPTAHLPLLRVLATFARRPEKIDRLLGASTPSYVVRALGTFKG